MNFNNVPKLCTAPYHWSSFPTVGDRSINEYLTAVFGGVHRFATLGDFGAMPAVMVEKLNFGGLDFLKGVNFKVSYDTERGCREDNLGIFDTLGCYDIEEKTITLFIQLIAEHAIHLDHIPGSPCAPCVMTLTALVFLHELGHAIHHGLRWEKHCTVPAQNLNGKIHEDRIFDEDFAEILTRDEVAANDLGGRKIEEKVAQHFMMTCIRAHGVRAEWLEEQMESRQSSVYSAWRDPDFATTWDDCRKLLIQSS